MSCRPTPDSLTSISHSCYRLTVQCSTAHLPTDSIVQHSTSTNSLWQYNAAQLICQFPLTVQCSTAHLPTDSTMQHSTSTKSLWQYSAAQHIYQLTVQCSTAHLPTPSDSTVQHSTSTHPPGDSQRTCQQFISIPPQRFSLPGNFSRLSGQAHAVTMSFACGGSSTCSRQLSQFPILHSRNSALTMATYFLRFFLILSCRLYLGVSVWVTLIFLSLRLILQRRLVII